MADFITTMVDINGGACVVECGNKFSELVKAIRNHRKKGKFVLEIEALPSSISGETGKVTQVQLTYKIKTTLPQPQPGLTTFFTTRDGDLMREDPDQAKMFEGAAEEVSNG